MPISSLASLLNVGLLLKERICSSRSKFFPLRVDPSLKGFCCLEKQTGSHKSCLLKKTRPVTGQDSLLVCTLPIM